MKNKIISVKKGDCILTEKPFVFVLKSKYRTERCDLCFAAGKVLKCSNCQYVYYCNRECQKLAWTQHKTECNFLKKIFPRVVPDAARILSRIILKLDNGGNHEKSFYTEKCFRQFKDLMSHYPDIKADPKRIEHIETLSAVLKEILGDVLMPNISELIGIYGRLVINGFNILDGEMNSVGTGIYLAVSVTDHNCSPNAVVTFENTTLIMRMLDDLPLFDWSRVFISYVDLINTPEQRQIELKQNYYFLCTCSKCIDPSIPIEMSYAVCPNQNCLQPLDLTYSKINQCCQCEEKITEEYREKFNETIELTKLHLFNMKEIAYLDVCKVCLKKQENLFHPLNLWRIKTLDMAFESAVEIGKWEEALYYGKQLIPGFRKYNGKLNPLTGLLYMKIGKIELYQGQFIEAVQHLKKAANILKITHGEKHSLFKDQLIPLLMEASI